MKTNISNGVMEPRSYQQYGDTIESKQAMEPIAIVGGTGPQTGFNIAWYTDIEEPGDGTFTGIMHITGDNTVQNLGSFTKGNSPLPTSRYSKIANMANEAGNIVNSYITPDGLLHVAPDTIELPFEVPSTVTDRRGIVYILVASHTYQDIKSEEVPSSDNFKLLILNPSNLNIDKILNGNHPDVLEVINNNLVSGTIDLNKDCIVGIYMSDWNNSWSSKYNSDILNLAGKSIHSAQALNLLPLIPIRGEYPVKPFGLGTFEFLWVLNHLRAKSKGGYGIGSELINPGSIDVSHLKSDDPWLNLIKNYIPFNIGIDVTYETSSNPWNISVEYLETSTIGNRGNLSIGRLVYTNNSVYFYIKVGDFFSDGVPIGKGFRNTVLGSTVFSIPKDTDNVKPLSINIEHSSYRASYFSSEYSSDSSLYFLGIKVTLYNAKDNFNNIRLVINDFISR